MDKNANAMDKVVNADVMEELVKAKMELADTRELLQAAEERHGEKLIAALESVETQHSQHIAKQYEGEVRETLNIAKVSETS